MKKFVIALMAVMMVTGLVYASEKPATEKPVLPVDMNVDLNENEPNDDCTMADYLTAGDNYSAAIDPAGEEDWFEVFFPAGGEVAFQTHPGDVGDTKLYLYADDCTTELAYNDDGGGQGYYSLIEYTLDANTTYFVRVTGYSSSTQGTYFLTMTEADPPCDVPANDTCAGALALPMCGTFVIDDMCGATNAYSPGSGGCTGYSANGLDLVYSVELIADQQLTVTGVTSFDNSIYLITDCDDPIGSCVAGADATTNGTETLVFDAASAPGTYYVILDGYSVNEAGWEVTVDCVVATEEVTFDSVKSMYR